MATTQGIFNTSQSTTDLTKKSFAGMITRLMPNGNAPLFALTSMLQTETAVAIEHGYFTKTMVFPSVVLGVAITSTAATVIDVVSSANILPGMILEHATTREHIIVDSILSATQLKVTRGVGVVAAATALISTTFFQVGNASEESSLRPNAMIITPVRVTNYTQIIRNTWAVSGTMRATMMIAGETNVAESKQDCAAFHAADIEKALIFGQKSQGTRNGQPFRTMDGVIQAVTTADTGSTNITTASATTTFTQLETALDPVFNQVTDPKGGNERILFVGGTARKVINGIGKLYGTVQIIDGQTSFGMQFSTFKTSRGTFRMIEHPLLNSNTTWAKYALALDLSTFTVAYLGDRKTENKEFNTDNDANDNGVDAVGGTLTTELTSVVKNPLANALITNLTAAE